MNADAVAALREALHDRHLDSEANGCDHHADEYGESLQCRDEAEALLAHPSFAALAAAPLPSESHYECWFCKGQFVEDALIAGYDTFDEQRLACLACNERMQGNWRPHAAPLPEPVWLIERGQPEGQVPTVWWWLAAGGREGWTEVATEAFHFESREAAEEIIAAKFTPPTSRGEASARAVEHSFIAAAPLPSEPVGRWEAVKQAPLLSDLRDAICFVERHDHLATSSYCQAGRAQAYRIREALIARYQFAAPSDTPADGLDVEELTDIIEQAIFETDTGLAAAMLAAGRIAALTQEPRSTREEDE